MSSMFERASRARIRFTAPNGTITVEDLWTVSMTTLDTIAKTLRKKLRDTEESFISKNSADENDELAFELVKYIITTRMAETAERKNASARAEQKQALLEILAKKQSSALENLSEEDLLKKIAELSV